MMKVNKAAATVYQRTIGIFLLTYLLLMIGFSIFLVSQEKNAADMELRAHALQVNNKFEATLQNFLDKDGRQPADISWAKNESLHQTTFLTLRGAEVAVFTSDYELLFNTENYWRCSYTKHKEGNKHFVGYAYLNPEDWFGEGTIEEIERYLYTSPHPQKVGDLSDYVLGLQGFWLVDGMVVPEKIIVTPMYAQKFDDKGNLRESGSDHADDIVYHSDYENNGTEASPYYEHGSIIRDNTGNPNSKERNELRRVVTDQARLKEASQGFIGLGGQRQRVGFLTYRYYLVLPYQNTVRVNDDKSFESSFWTVLGCDVNIGNRCLSSLAYVWISCFLIFGIAAFILAKQTLKIYQQQEKLESWRQEITNALAHDLKTPLGIIAGYAENLQANVHTEKREHYAHHIQTNVKRMDQIIQNMLELKKLETGYCKTNFTEVSLAEVCKIIIDRYKPVWEEKPITVFLEGEAVIKGDHTLMLRVIDNFFVNALDNTAEGGEIRIRIEDGTLEVYNSGSHIPEKELAEIWLPFRKGDQARSFPKGTGLGLAIARTILELHKFQYGVENKGEGVLFWFRFA